MDKLLLSDIGPDDQLTPHLKGWEILKASTWDKPTSSMDPKVFGLFELVRKYSGGTSCAINSAFRNFIPVGGSKNSSHLRGKALDIALTKEQKEELKSNLIVFLNEAYSFGLKGFAVYTWGVHVDCDETLPTPTEWQAGENDGSYNFFGFIRHWNKPLWLKKKSEQSGFDVNGKRPAEMIGHEDEVLKDSIIKSKYLIVVGFSAVVLSTLYIYFKNRKR